MSQNKNTKLVVNILLAFLLIVSLGLSIYFSFNYYNENVSSNTSTQTLSKQNTSFSGFETLNKGTIPVQKLEGKVVILNVWATWCPPCRIEIPELIELKNTYKKEN